jgi:hypothetical protein
MDYGRGRKTHDQMIADDDLVGRQADDLRGDDARDLRHLSTHPDVAAIGAHVDRGVDWFQRRMGDLWRGCQRRAVPFSVLR